ncbi:unnamed protein product [Diamesa serratosioi]
MFSMLSKKRSKGGLEMSTGDPINLPAEMREEIFRYLNRRELLDSCLVSSTWNEFIGNSDAFKKNVSIEVHPWSRKKPKYINNSLRNYDTFFISNFQAGPEIIFLSSKIWKRATIQIEIFPSKADYIKYLKYFCASIRDLKIVSTHIATTDSVEKLTLPFLEVLEFNSVPVMAVEPFVSCHNKLKSLYLKYMYESPFNAELMTSTLIEFFQLNNTIKDLELHADVSNEIFKKDFSENVHFELKTLTLCSDYDRARDDIIQDNLEKFMKSQAKSVEFLKLVFRHHPEHNQANQWFVNPRGRSNPEGKDFLIILKIWNHMKKLKKLAIRFMKACEITEEEPQLLSSLLPNIILNELHIQFNAFDENLPWKYLKAIIKASPNLEVIKIRHLSIDLLRFLALNMFKLKLVTCDTFENAAITTYDSMKISEQKLNSFIVIKGFENEPINENEADFYEANFVVRDPLFGPY